MRFSKTTITLSVLLTMASAVAAQASDKQNMSTGSKEMHEIMMDSAKKNQSMTMSGDTDKDFAMMMADHHRSGIKMAKAEIENGKNAELKALAQKIIDGQQKEITQLEKHSSMSH